MDNDFFGILIQKEMIRVSMRDSDDFVSSSLFHFGRILSGLGLLILGFGVFLGRE